MTPDRYQPTEVTSSHDFLSLVADITPVGILVVNRHGQMRYANQAAEQILCLSQDEILNRAYNDPAWQITDLSGVLLSEDRLPFARVLQTGKAINDVRISVKRGDGQHVMLSINARPLMIAGQVDGIVSTLDDITAQIRLLNTLEQQVAERTAENRRLYEQEQHRRRIAEGLRESLSFLNSNRPQQEILNHIVSQAVDLLHTQAGAIYLINEASDRLVASASQGLPSHYTDLEIPVGNLLTGRAVQMKQPGIIADIAASSETLQKFLEQPGTPADWRQGVNWIYHAFGAVAAIPIQTDQTVFGALTLYYDTPRVHSEDELSLATAFTDQAALVLESEALRTQLRHAAVSEERSRLARDLHDAVTQNLFSASMIAGVLPALWDNDIDEGRRRLAQLESLTRGAMAEMRTLLLELQPQGIAEGEMKDLLGHLVNAAAGQRAIKTTLHASAECHLPPNVKVAFYRIAQEALNNIIKHAEADQVMVSLQCLGDMVRLQVLDDGRGFDPVTLSSDHMGLRNMRERSAGIDADFRMDTAPGEGTDITVIWHTSEKETT